MKCSSEKLCISVLPEERLHYLRKGFNLRRWLIRHANGGLRVKYSENETGKKTKTENSWPQGTIGFNSCEIQTKLDFSSNFVNGQ